MTVPKGESEYIYGLHDRGGEHLMMDGGQAKGWVLVTEEIGSDPNDQRGSDYTDLANRGFGVLVRLNNAYGPSGTIPREFRYPDFARRVANFVRNSRGAHIWIIGNEMNLEREQPRQSGSHRAEPITPRRYATCYAMCRQAVHRLSGHEQDQVLVGAIGPWNAQTPYEADPLGRYPANRIPGPAEYPYNGFFGDYIIYLRDILRAIGRANCDGIAIHAYTHGYDPALIFSEEKMGPPFESYHYQFRTYRDQMEIIPTAFRDLPLYITEANGDREPGSGQIWPDMNRGWIQNAYKEINDWNRTGNQQIRSLILFRWIRDHEGWNIEGKAQVQQDFKAALAHDYTWQPVAVVTEETAPYRTHFIRHDTPPQPPAGQTVAVNLTVQNKGSRTWRRDGAHPFRLGYQWYTAEGQLARPPADDPQAALPADVPPGGTVQLEASLRVPDSPGSYHLRWDMIEEGVTWFSSQGDRGLLLSPIEVRAAAEIPPSTPTQIRDISDSLARHSTRRYDRRSTGAIRRVIIHHTATPSGVSPQRIAAYQVDKRDMPGIAYHYCVDAAGTIYRTQPPEVVSTHAGAHSEDSLGVCLIGNFTEAAPPEAQLNGAAALLAHLAGRFGGLSLDRVVGYNELVVTGSPGATWPAWKGELLGRAARLMTAAPAPEPTPTPEPEPTPTPTPAAKPIEHYLLFWHRGPDNWARWDLLGAFEYIDRFPATLGFSIEEAKAARYVTIVGGTGGVPAEAESILRAAGCRVERIAGVTEAETRRILEEMAAAGQRFRSL